MMMIPYILTSLYAESTEYKAQPLMNNTLRMVWYGVCNRARKEVSGMGWDGTEYFGFFEKRGKRRAAYGRRGGLTT